MKVVCTSSLIHKKRICMVGIKGWVWIMKSFGANANKTSWRVGGLAFKRGNIRFLQWNISFVFISLFEEKICYLWSGDWRLMYKIQAYVWNINLSIRRAYVNKYEIYIHINISLMTSFHVFLGFLLLIVILVHAFISFTSFCIPRRNDLSLFNEICVWFYS